MMKIGPNGDGIGSQSTAGYHHHHVKGIELERSSKSMVRAMVGRVRNKSPRIGSFIKRAEALGVKVDREGQRQVPDDGGFSKLDQGLVEKYGTRREIIGTGRTSVVWVSHKNVSGVAEQFFAIKGFRQSSGNEEEFQRRLKDEHQILSSLKHQNIIETLDLVYDEDGRIFEVLEFCQGGDMHTLLLQSGRLDTAEADCFFKQLMCGVLYMHEMGIAHRDLKLENIVLTRDGVVKITDFGESERFRVANLEIRMVGGLCGSFPYIAPEVYADEHFDASAADIWSTGVIYMAMRTGRYLWITADMEDEFYSAYVQDRRKEEGYGYIEGLGKVFIPGSLMGPLINMKVKAECSNVVYSILDPKPSRRITARQFLRTEWARSIQLCEAAQRASEPAYTYERQGTGPTGNAKFV